MRSVLILIAIAATAHVAFCQSSTPEQISIDSVKGRLHPTIGKVLEIEGKWHREEGAQGQVLKNPELFFIVESVNHKSLNPPLRYREQFVYFFFDKHKRALQMDAVVSYHAYEGIETAGIPREAFDHMLPRQVSIAFGVYSKIFVIDQTSKETKSPNQPAPKK